MDIRRDLHSHRTIRHAGNQSFFFIAGLEVLITESARGTDFDTDATKAATCIIIRGTSCTEPDFPVSNNIPKGLRSHNISTRSHAAETSHAEVVIPYEKRLVFFTVQVLRHIARDIFLDPDILSHLSELTHIKQRTAALIFWDICRTLRQTAALFLSTGQAGVRMLRKQGCQILLPECFELSRGCHDFHSLLHKSHAGENRIRLILDLDQAKTTALILFSLRIVLKFC
jgi:hypothetical protein